MTRTISVSIETGEEQTADELRERFFGAVDSAFNDDVEEVVNVVGENPEAAAGLLEFTTEADPEAMALEAGYMANGEFDHAEATVNPTEEEVEAAMEEMDVIPKIEQVDESLPAYDTEEERIEAENECDHPDGRLVRDESAPMAGGMVLCLDCGAGI